MLTLALARRLEGSGVSAACLDPGDVATTMLASGWPDLPGIPVEDGAVTSVYLASAPDAAGVSGVYFEDGAAVTPLAAALDVAAQERLWTAVEAMRARSACSAGYKPCGTDEARPRGPPARGGAR